MSALARMLLWLLLLAAPALAQEDEREFVRIEFEITALSGDGLYLDQGREALLQPIGHEPASVIRGTQDFVRERAGGRSRFFFVHVVAYRFDFEV